MLWKKLVPAIAAILSLGLLGLTPASAADLTHSAPPEGYRKAQVVHHYTYYPRYHHVYHVHRADPYLYRPEPRGYYPYYNSGYWRPAYHVHRPHYQLPRYYKAWGYTKPWHNKQWHTEHHGHHYPWHW